MFKYTKTTRKGDMLVVHIIDEFNNTLFTGRANINKKAEMKNLMAELEHKGVKMNNTSWFD